MPPAVLGPTAVRFTAASRAEMEAELESGTAYLRERAEASKDRGILVIRHSPSEFTLELHSSVPYGMTYERQEW